MLSFVKQHRIFPHEPLITNVANKWFLSSMYSPMGGERSLLVKCLATYNALIRTNPAMNPVVDVQVAFDLELFVTVGTLEGPARGVFCVVIWI